MSIKIFLKEQKKLIICELINKCLSFHKEKIEEIFYIET